MSGDIPPRARMNRPCSYLVLLFWTAGDGEECVFVFVFVFVFVWGRGGYLDVGEEVTGSWSKLHKRDFDILKVYTPFIILFVKLTVQ